MSPPYPWGLWLYGLRFIQHCRELPGDIIELGVGRGGSSLFLGNLARWVGKKVFSVDGFVGLPAPHPTKDNRYFKAGDYRPRGGDGEAEFRRAVARAGLTGTVRVCPGLFESSLPRLPRRQRFSFAHVDSDLYDSVRLSLRYVYPRLCEGGLLAIDDFFHPSQGALRATVEYFNELRLRPVYHVVFPYGVCVVKSEPPTSSSGPRAVDGNIYSLDWLKGDPTLMRTLREQAAAHRASAPGARATSNIAGLLELLQSRQPRSSDIYSYWRALEDYWDAISLDL